MKKRIGKTHRVNRHLPALMAVGSCMAVMPAAALELGNLTVQSSLGQPLRASIAFALAPNEALSSYCVTLQRAPTASGLPGVGRATLSVADGVILLTGVKPVREPMMAAHVVVDCPYTPKLQREYMLFVDPVSVPAPASAATATVAAAAKVAPAPMAAPKSAAAVVKRTVIVDRELILDTTRYQVQLGDSLSRIVQRMENRSMALWPAVNLIYDANPHAFMDNDPNRLQAGSWLTIPSLDGSSPILADAVVMDAAPAPSESHEPPVSDVAAVSEVDPVIEVDAVTDAVPGGESAVEIATYDLRPGDIILDDSSTVPTATATDNIVSTGRSIATPDTSASSPGWLKWLAGAGVAVIFALLVFGRRLRATFGSTPVGPAIRPQRRSKTSDTVLNKVINEANAGIPEPTTATDYALADIDYDLSDDSPTAENLALDADLIIGTGLEDGTEMDVAQDFGFAATSHLDIELPFEPDAAAEDVNPFLTGQTDILPPLPAQPSILESEVLPEEDDDYDMSVIVDATKMPQPEDVTERDLMAVEVEAGDETMISAEHTISNQTDYKIIEQDYEDEMTATQALNEEIARAAEAIALAKQKVPAEDATAGLPLASVTDIEVTAQMPAVDKEEDTVEMPTKSGKSG